MNILLVELFLEMRYKNVEKIGNQCKPMYHKLEGLHNQIFMSLFAVFEKLNY